MSISLVTGANRGLGFATARALAQAGGTVILTSRDKGQAETAAAGLRADGLDVVALSLDVTSPTSITAAVDQVRRDHGHLDVLVNNQPGAGATDRWTGGSHRHHRGNAARRRRLRHIHRQGRASRLVAPTFRYQPPSGAGTGRDNRPRTPRHGATGSGPPPPWCSFRCPRGFIVRVGVGPRRG